VTAFSAVEIAQVVHEANRVVQIVQADPTIAVSPHWDGLSEEMRASIIDGVHGVIGGHTPEQSHENWAKFKRDHGWTYGSVKDEAKKEHPLLVPYAELPESQQLKDKLFGAIVQVLS
jgi:hypothetical protein